MKSQVGGQGVHGDVGVRVCPTLVVVWDVGVDEIKDHGGHVVIESLGNPLLGAG